MSTGEQSAAPAQNAQLLLTLERINLIGHDVSEMKMTMARLADAVTKMAIIEERQIADRQSLGRAFAEIEKVSVRLQTLEQAQPIQKQSSDFVQKFIAAAAAAAIGAVGGATWGIKQPPGPQERTPVATGKP